VHVRAGKRGWASVAQKSQKGSNPTKVGTRAVKKVEKDPEGKEEKPGPKKGDAGVKGESPTI